MPLLYLPDATRHAAASPTALKQLQTDGLYEIRVQVGGDIFRIFCFFDQGNVVVVGHGFTKKTQKTLPAELDRAHKIKAEYYESL